MSAPPPPAVIGHGSPHTVGLREGSQVAGRALPRAPGDAAPAEAAPQRQHATLAVPDDATAATPDPAGPAPAAAPAPAPDALPPPPAAPPGPAGLGAATLQRIAALAARNAALRDQLDAAGAPPSPRTRP